MKKRSVVVVIAFLFCVSLATAGLAAEGTPPPRPPDGRSGATPPDGMGAPPDGNPPDGMGAPSEGAPPDAPGGGGGPGGMFGGSGAVTQGTAAATVDAADEIEGGTYDSTTADENALRITGAIAVTLRDIVVTKSGDTSNTEDSDFYGQNAALLATGGAQVTIENAGVSTNASGGNAVFSYGEGTSIAISDSEIRTGMNNSGGVHVAGGGALTATNLDVETQGSSAAAIRSDRGGGTLQVQGGTYTTFGTGSPAIYSTAAISAQNATFTANASEAVVVEGKHSVALVDSEVTGHMRGDFLADIKDTTHTVMIYQSMSGDAEQGQSSFSMQGGALTAEGGEMFYITNTDCAVALSGVEIALADQVLLRIAGNNGSRGWGQAGSNGGSCDFSATGQILTGQILVDDISSLNLNLEGGSTFTGCINPDGDSGVVNVTMYADCTWTLTADSHISALNNDTNLIDANGYHLYVGGDQVL